MKMMWNQEEKREKKRKQFRRGFDVVDEKKQTKIGCLFQITQVQNV